MSKKYWQSFGELNKSTAYKTAAEEEFGEDLPIEADDKGLLEAKTPRRDFLKYLGFSTAAAAIAASCEMPIKKAIPFANKPEDIIPGVANYYATTYVQDGDAISAIAKVRDGRPIKLEGNEMSPLTMGGSSARMQASVLDLYDTSRLRFPMASGREVSTFEAFDKMIAAEMLAVSGSIVLLTGSVTSPTTKMVIAQFLAKYPGSRHVQYDAVSYSGMLLANEITYGKKAIPSYDLAAAKVIVGLNSDFLASGVSTVEFNRQYAAGKRIDENSPSMSHHIQFESLMSMTGANADDRFHHRPSETGAVALALYASLGGAVTAPALDAKLQQAIKKTAAELKENTGKGLVICGSNDVNIQVIVNGINELIGANGSTIDWSSTYNSRQGIDTDMVALVKDMNSGTVGALLVHEANPVYNYFDSKAVADGIAKVKLTVSFNQKLDETSELCKYIIPDHHFLESWGEAEPKTGHISLIQPTINPLFKTRQWQDSLLKWSQPAGQTSAAAGEYFTFLKQYWVGKLGSEAAWDKALQAGLIGGTKSISATAVSIADTSGAEEKVPGMTESSGAVKTGFNGGGIGVAANAMGLVRSVIFGGVMTILIVAGTYKVAPKLRNLDLKKIE